MFSPFVALRVRSDFARIITTTTTITITRAALIVSSHITLSYDNVDTPAMGRKPNQLILEFFIRGQKLEDASNRYQHTCKACGEKFPKGRIDSLTNHLVKKCTAIPLRDRQRVLLRLHELPDLADGDPNKDPNVARTNKGKNGGDVSFTTTQRQNFDGLNVLAEASRQVGASDHGKRGGGGNHRNNNGNDDNSDGAPPYTQSVTVGGKTVVVDPALEAEGFQGNPTPTENVEEDIKPSGRFGVAFFFCWNMSH